MDPNLIDPSLLKTQGQENPMTWPVPEIIPSIAESINRLRRLPNQIGGVTIASLHSTYTEREPHSFTNFSATHANYQDGGLQPLSLGLSHVSNYITNEGFQAASLTQTPSAYHREVLHHETDEKATDLLAQAQERQSLNRQQTGSLRLPTLVRQQPVTPFPKFYCGEPECQASRTDGNSLSGRYAMSAHYKKKHPELKFDVTKLISSTNGQKSRRMSLKRDDDPIKTKKDSKLKIENSHEAVRGDIVGPVILSIPPENGSFHTQQQEVPTTINPSILSIHPSVPHRNYNVMVETVKPHLHYPPSMPKLPRVLSSSFTDVYDVQYSPILFKTQIRDLRATCDVEFLIARRLILAYSRMLNQPDTAFPILRKKETTRCLHNIHAFVTKAIGPSDLDTRAVGLGLRGDVVGECAVIYTAGLQRVHLPPSGIWPDGTVLSREESQRRFSCCELQAMKLCLFTFQKLVRIWTEKVESVAPGSSACILRDSIQVCDTIDCEMADA